MEPTIVISLANIKQNIWRERQLDIFYRTGRPIYNIDYNNQFLRAHYNPSCYKEANHEFWQSVFRPSAIDVSVRIKQ